MVMGKKGRDKLPKEPKGVRIAIKQLINATWVVRYTIPEDDINRTRRMCGEEPEAVILSHKRDDRYYCSTNKYYRIEESPGRKAETLVLLRRKKQGIHQLICKHPIRNKKYIFSYNYKTPIDANE